MRCKNCGGELRIEDAFCPYCGTPNPDAAKHRKDMKDYRERFKKTESDVYKKTKKYSRLSIKVIIVSVLLVLVLIMLVLNTTHFAIATKIEKSQVTSQVDVHRKKLKEFEEKEQYLAFIEYYDVHSLYYASFDELGEFRSVEDVSFDYRSVLNDISNLLAREHLLYIDVSDSVNSLCDNVDKLYKDCVKDEYDTPEQWTPEHTKAIENMKEEINLIIRAVCHFSEEDMETFEALSLGKKQVMIEEGLGIGKE